MVKRGTWVLWALGFFGSPFSDPRVAPVFDLELSISSNGSSEKIPIVPVVVFIPCRMLLPNHFIGFLLFWSVCVTQLLKGTMEVLHVSQSYKKLFIQDWILNALKSLNSCHSICLMWLGTSWGKLGQRRGGQWHIFVSLRYCSSISSSHFTWWWDI